MFRQGYITVLALLAVGGGGFGVKGAELDVLRLSNWELLAPKGPSVRAVLGDYVLVNDRIVAVVANHELRMGRSSGRIMLQAGGGVVDLTFRDRPNDLLTLFRLGADVGSVASDLVKGAAYYDPHYADAFERQEGVEVTLTVSGKPHYSYFCPAKIRYTLRDGEAFVRVEVEFYNTGEAFGAGKSEGWWLKRRRENVKKSIAAQLKAERDIDVLAVIMGDDAPDEAAAEVVIPRSAPATEFVCQCPSAPYLQVAGKDVLKGRSIDGKLTWAYDHFMGQAYGVWSGTSAQQNAKLKPEETHKIWAMLIPGDDLFAVRRVANELGKMEQFPLRIKTVDERGPRAGILIRLESGRELYGAGKTGADGVLEIHAPDGLYKLVASTFGEADKSVEVRLPEQSELNFSFVEKAWVTATVRDQGGVGLPCKVEFRGLGETPDPQFFNEDGSNLVGNLVYTTDGKLRQEVPAGHYRIIATRGPEYNFAAVEVKLEAGTERAVELNIERVVESSGWVSVDFNTLSARSAFTRDHGYLSNTPEGRLLNLVAEQIDFAPTTESNTVADDTPLVKSMGLGEWISVCSGIRLTRDGRKYAFNEQCAFPIPYKKHQQDGGVPQRPQHCSQIDWLRSWGSPFPPDDPWEALRNIHLGYEKLIVVTQTDNTMAPEHVRNYDLYSSMWRDADIAIDWRDKRAFFKPLLRDSDGDGIPDRISHHTAATVHAWDVRTLDSLNDPKKRLENDILCWLETVRHGWRLPAVIGSAAHHNFHGVGRFRSYVRYEGAKPGVIDPVKIMAAVKKGHVFMTTGPFVDLLAVTANSEEVGGPGDMVMAQSREVAVNLTVQAPNWIEVEEVEVLRNGVTDPAMRVLRSVNPDRFMSGPVQFKESFAVELHEDTHFIAIVRGSGPNLRQRKDGGEGKLSHAAITNPVYIDLHGDGFLPQSPVDDMVATRMRLTTPLLSREGAVKGVLEISATNHSAVAVRDVVRLKFVPEGVVKLADGADLTLNMAPHGKTNIAVNLELTDESQLAALLAMGGGAKTSATAWLLRSGKPPGVAPARLLLVVDGGAEAEKQMSLDELQDTFR
ncbi:MAG: hypothetical protein GX230_05540 [Lentisphaerae bacterium]|nr:hypothetical protein [Lentisphaerota bacterium]